MRMPRLWGLSPRTVRLLIFDLMRLSCPVVRGDDLQSIYIGAQ
jgi:hypothetical protein